MLQKRIEIVFLAKLFGERKKDVVSSSGSDGANFN